MTDLNGGAVFNAEFGIKHRAAPYRKGQVLHSVFAAAPAIAALTLPSFQGQSPWLALSTEGVEAKPDWPVFQATKNPAFKP